MDTDLNWTEDFSYNKYLAILKALQKFKCIPISKLPTVPSAWRKSNFTTQFLILQHDLDVDPDRALNIAQMEKDHDLKSVYMVMINSPLYKIEDHLETLNALQKMGNEIGLHFYRPLETGPLPQKKLEVELKKDCKLLEDILGTKIKSISFHRPFKEYLRGPIKLANRVNSYTEGLMTWYINDSMGRFRAGEPISAILSKKLPLLHFLTHPFWWTQKHADKWARVQDYLDTKVKSDKLSKEQKLSLVKTLFDQIAVYPTKYRHLEKE